MTLAAAGGRGGAAAAMASTWAAYSMLVVMAPAMQPEGVSAGYIGQRGNVMVEVRFNV
ncbi:hypothetical protein GCM10022256_33670 [Frondihabitans peucedani]|uniref:Uncharacterized protein n=1 Tax=Frondihabitans peucedani TaxID=598626 RepID=A0ABP8E683_9MICO